jgi:hypothetical protein
MTYREAVQIQVSALQRLYDNADCLRDCATDEEKAAWNYLRKVLPGCWSALQSIDNRMDYAQANQKLKGNYSFHINEQSV